MLYNGILLRQMNVVGHARECKICYYIEVCSEENKLSVKLEMRDICLTSSRT